MRPVLIFLAVTSIGCTTISAPPTPQSATIRLSLHMPIDSAYRRAAAAFFAEGVMLGVGTQAPGLLVTVPTDLEPGPMAPITYRCALLQEDSATTTAILSGTLRNNAGVLLGQALTGLTGDPGDRPLHSAMKGDLFKAWQRLERVAAMLQRQAPPD